MSLILHKIFTGVSGYLKSFWKGKARLLKKFFYNKETFTIMIVPHTPVKKVKSVKFSKWIISFFVTINFIIFAVVCTFGYKHYILNIQLKDKLKEKNEQYQAIQKIKEYEEQQLNEYKQNETVIKEKIRKLEDLESKVRDIIDKKGEPQSFNSTGVSLASRSTIGLNDIKPLSSVSTEFENFDDMYDSVDELIEQANGTLEEYNMALTKEENAAKAARAKPLVLPTSGRISSGYGRRKNPFGRGYEFHTGIDIANSKGTPIMASGDGIITLAGRVSGYGNLVKIDHGNGYESLYGHNSKIVVHIGQQVSRGDIIAYMGSTGRSTGNHCHFEIRLNGKVINPNNVK